MKVLLFRYSVPLVYFLSAVVMVLIIVTLLLYFGKSKAETYNRFLILQNDSILSEHIRLKNAFQQQQGSRSEKKATHSSITLVQQAH
jgi:hypothetical protein